jgi:hypothetical protein
MGLQGGAGRVAAAGSDGTGADTAAADGTALGGLRARQAAVTAAAAAFLQGDLVRLPAYRLLQPHLAAAAVWAVGGRTLELEGAADLELECILGGEAAAALHPGEGRGDLDAVIPAGARRLRWRVRSAAWLTERLGDPAALWLHQRAVVVQDPAGILPAATAQALAAFRRRLPGLVAERYRWLRTGLEHGDGVPDRLARSILVVRALEAALTLPLLARGEPFPPAPWLPWQLARVCPDGEEIVGLCRRLQTGPTLDHGAAATLRRHLDDLLEVAGYGETLVRNFWHRA